MISTVSGAEKAARARKAGADHVIDYRTSDVAVRIRELTDGAGVERIVEVALGANFPASAEAIANNGVIAAYASDAEPQPSLPFRPLLYKNVSLRHVLVFGVPDEAKAAAVADITRWLAAGELENTVGQRFPLAEAAKAHEAVERGSLGNVVVEIREG